MNAKETKIKIITTAVIFLLSFIGVISIFIATRWGIGVSPDSIAYIGGARSLLAGHGYAMPGNDVIGIKLITHYPPFYSILIAGTGWLGVDPIVGAKMINALIFGAVIGLTGFLLVKLCQGLYPTGYWISVAGSMLVLTSFTIIEIHYMAWTEPAFIFLSLLGFIWLTRFLEGSKIFFMIAAAIAMGFALLTRYAGIALVFSGVAGILLFARSPILKRIQTTILFSFLSMGFTFLWMIRNQSAAGSATNRELYFRAFSTSHFWESLDTFSSWLLIPESAPNALKIAPFLLTGCAVLAFIVYLIFNNGIRQTTKIVLDYGRSLPLILKLFFLYLPAYAGVLVVTNSLLDTYTPLDDRILSPIYVPLLVLSLYFFGDFFHFASKNQPLKVAFSSGFLIFLVFYFMQGSQLVLSGYQEGIGFNSLEWTHSDVLPHLNRFSARAAFYSNAPEAIYIHTGRPAIKLPRKTRTVDDLSNENFDTEWALMRSRINDGVGVIVYFDVPWRHIPQFEEEVIGNLAVDVFVEAQNGTIYVPKNN